jgi:hypothetical protein
VIAVWHLRDPAYRGFVRGQLPECAASAWR